MAPAGTAGYPARMRGQARILINTPDIELWPGGLLRARSNHDARALSRARHVLRRKRDGQYRAVDLPEGLLAARRHLENFIAAREWPRALEGWRRPLLEPVLRPLLPAG
jgi:hypothetical protein